VSRDELEDELRFRRHDGTLAVYADHLQAAGDPRGELIALDLLGGDAWERRGELLRAWLGDCIRIWWDEPLGTWCVGDPETTQLIVDRGFVEVVHIGNAGALLPFLAHPASAYTTRISIAGDNAALSAIVNALAAHGRPWLEYLGVRRDDRAWELLVAPELRAWLVAATPRLAAVEVQGERVFDALSHPALRSLGVTGARAIETLFDGPALPELATLELAFASPDDPLRELVITTGLTLSRFPGLRRLHLGNDEPGARLFACLPELGVAPAIRQLTLPSLRSYRDVAHAQAALDRMPLLREVHIARAYSCFTHLDELRHPRARIVAPEPWPWPPRERARMMLVDHELAELAVLVDALEEHHDELPADLRSMWARWWRELSSTYDVGLEVAAGELAAALAPLAIDGDDGWRAVLDHVTALPPATRSLIRFAP
jgi:hypothetical protein